MEDENLGLLRALHASDRAEESARRRALWTSALVVVAAAAILATVLFSAYRELNAVQASTRALRADSTRLEARVAELRLAEENLAVARRHEYLRNDYALPVDTQVAVYPDTSGASAVNPPPPAPLPPRVYMQIVAAGDRAYALRVGERLDSAGFTVIGVEHVRNAAPLRNTELRYYKRADEPDAQRLLQALRAAGEPNAVLLYLGLENNTRVRPRHYEVWFAPGAGQRPAGEPRAASPP